MQSIRIQLQIPPRKPKKRSNTSHNYDFKISNYLNFHKNVHQRQSGFRKGHSTESALISMIETWLKVINDRIGPRALIKLFGLPISVEKS